MAEVLDKFPKNAGKGRFFSGDPQWLDGRVWKLHPDRDLYMYKSINSARTSLRYMSIQYGWSGFRTRISSDNCLIIQCYELRGEWDGSFDYDYLED